MGKWWWEERTIAEKVVMITGLVILGIGAIFLFGLVVMWLWNWLMPDIFGLPHISYWQAWGLLLLSSILFKNVGSGSGESGRRDRRRKRKLRESMSNNTRVSDTEAGGTADKTDEDAVAPDRNPTTGGS